MKIEAIFQGTGDIQIYLTAENVIEERLLSFCENKAAIVEVIHTGHPDNHKVARAILLLKPLISN